MLNNGTHRALLGKRRHNNMLYLLSAIFLVLGVWAAMNVRNPTDKLGLGNNTRKAGILAVTCFILAVTFLYAQSLSGQEITGVIGIGIFGASFLWIAMSIIAFLKTAFNEHNKPLTLKLGLYALGVAIGLGVVGEVLLPAQQPKTVQQIASTETTAVTATQSSESPTALSNKSRRTFVESEFYWDKYNRAYKDLIVKGANKVFRENPRCHTLDPESATTSISKGTKNDPMFYVSCKTEDGEPFNVFFSKSDVKSDKSLAAVAHIDRGDALIACRDYAKAHAMHPSSVDFSTFMDLGTKEFPNGRTRLDSSFTAKNSFNMEVKFNITCMFEGGNLIEGNIYEAE